MVAKKLIKQCAVSPLYSFIISHTEETKDPCQSCQAKKFFVFVRSVRHSAFRARDGNGLNDEAVKKYLLFSTQLGNVAWSQLCVAYLAYTYPN